MNISANHPALPGHFPGHPVVPGVVLLDAVVKALPAHAGAAVRVTGFPTIKFTAPVLPEREFEIRLIARRPGQSAFEIVAGDTRLATGTVSYEAA